MENNVRTNRFRSDDWFYKDEIWLCFAENTYPCGLRRFCKTQRFLSAFLTVERLFDDFYECLCNPVPSETKIVKFGPLLKSHSQVKGKAAQLNLSHDSNYNISVRSQQKKFRLMNNTQSHTPKCNINNL